MARLLRDLDYEKLIQDKNLDQVLDVITLKDYQSQQIKLAAEQVAQSEMISYLSQRYDIPKIFTDTKLFDIASVYKGKNLVEYTEPVFIATVVYSPATRISFGGNIYQCSATTIAGESPTTTPAKWTKITEDYNLYYITLPKPEYSSTTKYTVNTQVWFEDSVYTNTTACSGIEPTNTGFWSVGVPYTVTAILPTDTTKWTKGDNRNQQIVYYLIDIALYHMHPRVSHRNISDNRKERYNGNSANDSGGAIGWLMRCASGDITADLPSISPEQGMSIRYGNAGTHDSPSNNMLW